MIFSKKRKQRKHDFLILQLVLGNCYVNITTEIDFSTQLDSLYYHEARKINITKIQFNAKDYKNKKILLPERFLIISLDLISNFIIMW